MKSDKELLELFEQVKSKIICLDFPDQIKQATYRKLRHHLDMMIQHLSK